MRAGKTELRGTSREGHTANRRRGWIGKLRSTATQRAEGTARLITTIAVIVALIGGAGPAAAQVLVTNLSEPSIGGYVLGDVDFAQPFTTGTNASGYQLESISLNFRQGRSREHEPVYVYLYGDNGRGGPNDRDQIATLTKNGATFEGPVAGVNKYTVRKYGRRPAPFNASSVHLDANTQYWVFVWAGEDDTLVNVDDTASNEETGAAGWSIGDKSLIKPEGSADSNYTDSITAMKIQVEGYANPEVLISVSDATATEGVDETADFVVTLNRSWSRTITVKYITLFTKSATPGVDYENRNGTLTFRPGETSKIISVPIIDDTENDSGETFELLLYDAKGADLDDDVGTGTIINTEILTGSFENVPGEHDGSTPFTFDAVFNSDIGISYATLRDHSFTVTNGDVTGASRVDGRNDRWLITVDPDGDDAVTITLPGNRACGTQGAICSKEDNPVQLSNSPSATVAAPPAGDPLTASFSNVPDDHDGGDFFVDLTFSEGPDVGYKDVQRAFTVSGGSINRANRKTKGSNVGWKLTVRPTGTDSLTITLPATTNCSSSGAICTEDGRKLSNSSSATVAGPAAVVETTPTVSIAGGSGTEGDDDSIAFTVTLDEAASETVTVDYATSDGSAEAGDDYTAASGTLSFAAGETSKAISVAIDDDIDNESDETFTVTLSNASGADLATKTATGTIRNRTVALLTARFENMPSEHAGEGTFTFGLTFSEEVTLSYKTLRDAALNVSGGAVRKAKRRQQGSNLGWTITVEPDGDEPVTIRLPATTDCDASGAICTADDRGLSHSLSARVADPVGISVADAQVEEGADAVLAFVVTLDRAASGTLTVDYATSDGTATAGEDYTATSGTLTFEAGESSKTIEVTVLDDAHDEGEETLTLRLSNPSGGRVTDGEATGTIENRDPLPKALLARFGRAAAVHVVEQVQERIEAQREVGIEAQFAGRQLRPGMEREMAVEFLSRLAPSLGANRVGAGVPHPMSVSPVAGSGSLGTPGLGGGAPMGTADELLGGANPMGSMPGTDGGLNQRGHFGRGLGGGNLLTGSAFVMNHETRRGGILSFWSRGAQSRFAGRDGKLSLDGRVRTTMFGADYAKGPLITGLSLSHSRGLGGYSGVSAGEVTSSVTGLYPWLGYKVSDRITLWGVTGYGKGALTLTPGAGTALRSGLSMAMTAGGMRGELADSVVGGFGLAFKADALWVGTGIEGVDGPQGRLAATSAAVTRYRTALEASRDYRFQRGLSLQPSLEVGVRRDGGDAENGVGVDFGGGLIVSDALTGLSADVRVRMLLVHQDQGFRDRGMSVSFSYNPTPSTPLGFTAKLTPSWGGQATSGARALWGRETMTGMAHGGMASGNRLEAELGYGLPVGSRLVGTPRFGIGTSEYGRDYRLGYGLTVLQRGSMNFELGIEGTRQESSRQGVTDHGALARLTARW